MYKQIVHPRPLLLLGLVLVLPSICPDSARHSPPSVEALASASPTLPHRVEDCMDFRTAEGEAMDTGDVACCFLRVRLDRA